MKINIKREFGETIAERGYGYYLEGRVTNVLKAGDAVTATVEGTHRYKVSINLKKDEFNCNCPYEGGLCKHLAVVCYVLNSGKKVKTGEAVAHQLGKRSKKELIRVLQEILAEEPNFSVLLLPKDEQIKKKIRELDEEGEDWQEWYDLIPNRVQEITDAIQDVGNPVQIHLLLLRKLHIMNHQNKFHEMIEDDMFFVLEKIGEEK